MIHFQIMISFASSGIARGSTRRPLTRSSSAAGTSPSSRTSTRRGARRARTLAFDFKCPDRGKGKGNFEVPFSRFPELFRARSRLYRSQILQVNIRWKALVEIYTMHAFAPFSDREIRIVFSEKQIRFHCQY